MHYIYGISGRSLLIEVTFGIYGNLHHTKFKFPAVFHGMVHVFCATLLYINIPFVVELVTGEYLNCEENNKAKLILWATGFILHADNNKLDYSHDNVWRRLFEGFSFADTVLALII